jgi:hypothetical protein
MLEANPKPLNEYSLGIDVFDRGESFDPATDTIVRVQGRRVRAKLENYYASEGNADPIVIEVPKGQYRAVVRVAPAGGYQAMPSSFAVSTSACLPLPARVAVARPASPCA